MRQYKLQIIALFLHATPLEGEFLVCTSIRHIMDPIDTTENTCMYVPPGQKAEKSNGFIRIDEICHWTRAVHLTLPAHSGAENTILPAQWSISEGPLLSVLYSVHMIYGLLI
jgi:hypothetical protein